MEEYIFKSIMKLQKREIEHIVFENEDVVDLPYQL